MPLSREECRHHWPSGAASVKSVRAALGKRQLIYLRDLLGGLVAREMKLRYKRSILGIAWTLLNPLAQLLVFHFVFSMVLPLNIPNYAAFLFIGILAWSWFQASLDQATGAIVNNRDLIKRPGFPVAILPVVTVTSHLLHFLLALPLLFLFLSLSGGHFTGALLFLPLVIGLQFLLILSLAYLVASFHVSFRDTQYLLGVLLQMVFFLTPVFYHGNIVPARYQLFYRLNPMLQFIDSYRAILLHGETPDLGSLLILGVVACGLLFSSYTIFVRASYRFVEEL